METQFNKTLCPYLRSALYQLQDQEQTQELRLPEGMPDVGRILGAWGQALMRSKEWQPDAMHVTCGCMAWVLYEPEGGGVPQSVQAWIPFQQSIDHTAGSHEGVMQVQCLLRSIDARTVSARKIMLRATLNVLAHGWVHEDGEIYTRQEVPEDVCLLEKTYPLCLLSEAGEKSFVLDEELSLPGSAPALSELVRYGLRSELIDTKVLTDKVVFRGIAVIHILYTAADGSLHSSDLEVPFSQFSSLSGEYDDDALADICVALTSLELETDPEGRLRLKAGLTGQYTVYTTRPVTLVEDAYSPGREVSLQTQPLQLPAVLDRGSETLTAQLEIPFDGAQVVDTAFYPDHPRCVREQDHVHADISGVFHILYRDADGQLQPMLQRWQDRKTIEAAAHSNVQLSLSPSGGSKWSVGGELQLKNDVILHSSTLAQHTIPMVTALELGQLQEKDPDRPSLILARAGEHSLWELAKENGSTVEAICSANALAGDQDLHQQILLIPVC